MGIIVFAIEKRCLHASWFDWTNLLSIKEKKKQNLPTPTTLQLTPQEISPNTRELHSNMFLGPFAETSPKLFGNESVFFATFYNRRDKVIIILWHKSQIWITIEGKTIVQSPKPICALIFHWKVVCACFTMLIQDRNENISFLNMDIKAVEQARGYVWDKKKKKGEMIFLSCWRVTKEATRAFLSCIHKALHTF